MCVSTGFLRSMGIILRTQKMAAGHAAAAFHKHCIKLHYGWLERRLSPSSFSLERRGRSQRIVLDPGIHVQQAKSSRETACSLALAAEEAIGRGSCAFSRLDVPRAGKIPAARPRLITARPRRRCLRHLPRRHANMDDAFLILTLWFLLWPPPPTESLFTLPVLKYRHIPKVPYADIRIVRPTAKGPGFHPIDNFVINITAAAAIASQG